MVSQKGRDIIPICGEEDDLELVSTFPFSWLFLYNTMDGFSSCSQNAATKSSNPEAAALIEWVKWGKMDSSIISPKDCLFYSDL